MKRFSNYLFYTDEGKLVFVWSLCFGLGPLLGYGIGALFEELGYSKDIWLSLLAGISLGALVAGWYLYRLLQARYSVAPLRSRMVFALFWIMATLLANGSFFLVIVIFSAV